MYFVRRSSLNHTQITYRYPIKNRLPKSHPPHTFETTLICYVCAGRTPGMRTSLTNLLMKINLKCGGRNYRLSYEQDHPARFASIGQKRTCIYFGADVSHPSSASDRGTPSIAAVVASNDWPDSGRFIARYRQQVHRLEIISDLQAIVVELLNEWKLANQNRLPDVLRRHISTPLIPC